MSEAKLKYTQEILTAVNSFFDNEKQVTVVASVLSEQDQPQLIDEVMRAFDPISRSVDQIVEKHE